MFFNLTPLFTVCVCVHSVVSVMFDSVQPYGLPGQVPLSMGFSRQEYWSGLPCHPPGDIPDSGIELGSPALQEVSLMTKSPEKPIFSLTL